MRGRLVPGFEPRTFRAAGSDFLDDPHRQLPFLPVDPGGSPPGAAVSHFPFAVDREAERILPQFGRSGTGRQDGFDGFFLEDADTVVAFAEVHQHFVELILVGGGGPESRARGRINIRSVVRQRHPRRKRLEFRFPARFDIIHQNDVLELFVRRIERRRLHFQRIQHAFFEEDIPAFPGDRFDDRRADVDPGIGIFHSGPRFEQKGIGGGFTGRGADRDRRPAFFAFGRDFEREAAGMIHHHADRERVFGRDQSGFAVFALDRDFQILEFRQIFGHRIIQGKFAFFDQDRDRDAAEPFGLRTLHVKLVHADRDLLVRIGITEQSDFLFAVLIQNADGSGTFAGFEVGSEGVGGIMRAAVLRFLHGGAAVLRFLHGRAAAGEAGQDHGGCQDQ